MLNSPARAYCVLCASIATGTLNDHAQPGKYAPHVRLSRRTKIDLLKRIPLFAGCSRAELEAVSSVADELRLPAGRVLMRQGAPGRELFVLVEGEVRVERDGVTIAVRRGGDFIGELALITGRPRSATVTAVTDLQTLVLERLNFDRLLRDVPTIAAKVLKAVAERLPPEDA
jgi:CRP/FNR family cyclic AMP-dependent transcriptional regulator